MKNMRKVFTMILALAMVLSLAATAFASEAEEEETTYTLTINNSNPDHTYEAYQIFAGDLATVNEKPVLSNITWGEGVKSADLLAAINASTLTTLHGATTAAELAEKIANTITTDSVSIDLLAELIGANLTTVVSGTSTGTGPYTIDNLSAGYYLIKDKDGSMDEAEGDSYTKYIIHVLNTTTLSPKGTVPSVDKKISDVLTGDYDEYEDFDINDRAYYKWTGTLPSNLTDYASYYYKFTDTLSTGLAFVEIKQIYIEGHDDNVVHTFYDSETDESYPAGIDVDDVGPEISVEFTNLLTSYDNLLPSHKIVVKYEARITRDAQVDTAIPNSVELEYSNNPNGTGAGDTGSTPEDEAYAFTFGINVDKFDADNDTIKLEGAEFVLYYERTENDALVQYYAQVVTEEMIAAGEEINGTAVDADDLGVVYNWTTDVNAASILDTDSNGHIGVRGLDSGIFYLKETNPPAGYNLMETPVMIEIIPTYAADGSSVTVSYEVDSREQDTSIVGVRNSSGSTLPSTGGIGTTIFYILGGMMVLGASVLLVTKKRMGAAE